uniref:Uncharacterized protein n=1 Tax=Anguilla anguilla TaxID=7936 RepID=A0A0E9PG26_ANGAN
MLMKELHSSYEASPSKKVLRVFHYPCFLLYLLFSSALFPLLRFPFPVSL